MMSLVWRTQTARLPDRFIKARRGEKGWKKDLHPNPPLMRRNQPNHRLIDSVIGSQWIIHSRHELHCSLINTRMRRSRNQITFWLAVTCFSPSSSRNIPGPQVQHP
mmetsp:Transcript_12603/g.21539  ORF Transcript_12603/g.21539 Transcript_12603/m.21539 type:complete len:106 (+) Transcript_12603:72-389(+)